MSSGERKTIINVLILYLGSTILLIMIVAYGYYHTYIHDEQERVVAQMKLDAKKLYEQLQSIHNSMETKAKYPHFDDFQSAIFDTDKNLLYSTLHTSFDNWGEEFSTYNGYNRLIYEMSPYYMGVAFIVIEKKETPLMGQIGKQVGIVTLLLIIIMALTSLFLVKLILKPLRDSFNLLDRFIRDTTHELNTPVSTILTNVELLEGMNLDPKIEPKLNRIKIASLTISHIYDDLVFLLLNHKVATQNIQLDINKVLKERLEYFKLFFEAKGLTVILEETGACEFLIDKQKMVRIIDNILSNSIKYTNPSTTITIRMMPNQLSFQDQGDGMSSEEIGQIYERYSRFDNSQGGFGLGYNIVHTIAREYNITIIIDSKIGEGTCVTLQF